MLNQPDNITIMFSDIAGSTQLFEKLGNKSAQRLINNCLEKLIGAAEKYKGKLVKTIGDETMCLFLKPEDAADAAFAQQDLTSIDPELLHYQIKLRIGFHHGPVIFEKNDVFGDAVIVAARVVALSKASQILTTKTTIDYLTKNQQALARLVDQTRVKGKHDPIELFELSWGKPEELTIAGTIHRDLPMDKPENKLKLCLTFSGRKYIVDQNSPLLSMGRDSINTITINDPRVSRLHAHIEVHKDGFIIADKSTNGTYLYPDDGPMILLRRDEIKLRQSGKISLGQQMSANSPFLISFSNSPDEEIS